MATQGERIEALELKASYLEDALNKSEAELAALQTRVDEHTATLAEQTAAMPESQPIPAAGADPRGELLKLFRQVEALANHLNFRLPA